MAHRVSQWFDDDPSRGEQEATPQPKSVYSKLSECQVTPVRACLSKPFSIQTK
jgi:hypothetical protein